MTGAARPPADLRIGVVSFQHECNSFAPTPTGRSAFTILDGPTAARRLQDANSEYGGALSEIARLGLTAVPLLWAHALPSGPLTASARHDLTELVLESIDGAGDLAALVVVLHGACAAEDEPLADAALTTEIRRLVGTAVPIAVSLDLHGNPTEELVRQVDVLTGYRTNPHVDLADTGARAVGLLARTMVDFAGDGAGHGDSRLRPVLHLARCPAIFRDECLRIPGGPLASIVERVVGRFVEERPGTAGAAIADISIFPTQPWLDAPGVGFTAVVTGDAIVEPDTDSARTLAGQLADAVWEQRTTITAPPTLEPADAVARVVAAGRDRDIRPGIVTEAADAPTAGAAGDGTGVLRVLVEGAGSDPATIDPATIDPATIDPATIDTATSIRDPMAVAAAFAIGVGGRFVGPIGGRIDPRWTEPVAVDATVVHLGDGTYPLGGAGYAGMTVTMGRHAVLATGRLRILVTELAAWSADPSTWRHAGIEPDELDLLVVKSCTDYRANFPDSAPFAEIAGVPGPATPDLSRLRFRHVVPPPYPTQGWADTDAALRESSDG